MDITFAKSKPTRGDTPLHVLHEQGGGSTSADYAEHGGGSGGSGRIAPRRYISLHRRFFTAGIITTLTAGAAWGVVLLWQLAINGSFTGISIHHINAHGHAQIFGWVALFIMGFAYTIFPRMWRAGPVNAAVAQAVFVLMLTGLLASITGIAMPSSTGAWAMALVGGIAQVAACTIFATQMVRAALRHPPPEGVRRAPIDASKGFILSACVWLVVMSVFGAWHALAIISASSPEALLRQLRVWQPALRNMQVHGLAMFMILGVSIRLLPGMFGLPKAHEKRARIGLVLLVSAVVLECTFLIVSQATKQFAIAAGLLLPWILLPVGVLLIIWPWRLWRSVRFGDRSAKFVRIAYAWLFLSFALLLFLPIYQWLLATPFSHAYYGAARHAITVGFVSMMIVGISSKMAPGLRGMNIRSLPSLWVPFILINLGCMMRVSLQIASDWTPVAFRFIGVSGVMELAGLAVWATHLIYVMWLAPTKRQIAAREPAPG